MGSSLNYMSNKERSVLERFGETLINRLGVHLVRISAFGSKVRGDFREASDIDILVIVKERTLPIMDKIAEITSDMNIEYDLALSPVVFSEQEYEMNVEMASPFSLVVNKEEVPLV